jgi:cytochrome c
MTPYGTAMAEFYNGVQMVPFALRSRRTQAKRTLMEATALRLPFRGWLRSLMLAAAGAVLALPAVSAIAQTPDGQGLARKLNCMSCHAIDRTLLGPSFAEIAVRYEGKPEARDALARKIQTGGSGAWGSVPMPANTQVNDEQAHLLVDWILQIRR